MGNDNEGGVIKSEDHGETLEEAGLSEDTDDSTDEADTKDNDTEPDAAGESGDDAGTEGEKADGDRTEHDEKGESPKSEGPTEVEALKTLLEKREADFKAIKEAKEKENAPPPPAPPTEEQWVALEERFGGLSRSQITPIADMMEKAVSRIQEQYEVRLAGIEKDMTINRLADQEGTRDIRSHRAEMEQFLGNFDKKSQSDEKLLKMALVYARGLKSKDAVRKAGESREKNLRVIGSGRPSTSGQSAGGSAKSIKLSAQERSVAKAAGWSDKEYHDMKYGGRK
jgi:hypothetical protein